MTIVKRSLAVMLLAVAAQPALAAEQKLEGYADFRKQDALIVDGQRLVVSPSTRYKGKHAGRFEAIALGWEVKAKGIRQADGSLLASELEAKPNGGAMFEGETLRGSHEAEQAALRLGYLPQDFGLGRVRLQTTGKSVERARALAERLYPPYKSKGDFRVYVVTADEWNAFATPNGMIVVHSSLLDDFDDDEVAIVLGHEIAHTTYEHSRRRAKKRFWAELGGAVVAVAAQGIQNDDVREAVEGASQVGALIFTNKHSRANEDQSDRVGLRYAYEAGFDVTKAPGVWRKFAQRNGQTDRLTNFIYGSHSLALDRAQNLERELALNYGDVTASATRTASGPKVRKPREAPVVVEDVVEEPAEEEESPDGAGASYPEEDEVEVGWDDEEGASKALLDEDGFVLTEAELASKSLEAPQPQVGMTRERVKAVLGPPIVAFEDVMVYPKTTLFLDGDRVREVRKVDGEKP